MDRLTSHFVFGPTMMILVAMNGVSEYQLNALLESALEDRQVIITFGSRAIMIILMAINGISRLFSFRASMVVRR